MPERDPIPPTEVQGVTIDGDTWVAYHPEANRELLTYIHELENAAEQCGGI